MTTKTPFGHAVRWAYAMTIGQRGFSLVLTFLLAAILGPRDFGIIAMAMAYILFVEMLVTQGMGAGIIQRKELTPVELDSIFVLLVGASVVFAGLSAALSGWWAGVNHVPELGPVLVALSLSIPIRGVTIIQQSLLEREMKFRELAFLRGTAVLGGGTAGIALALGGAGVWALVVQHLATAAIASALMWRASAWRPRRRFSWSAVRDLLKFSSSVLATQLGSWTTAQADSIVMGLFFGPLAVGLYRIGERIMSALLEVASRSIQIVALPHFSDVRDDPEELHDAVLECIRISATITIPLLTIAGAVADDLLGLLGERWVAAAGVLRVVVILGMSKSIVLFVGPLLYAVGRPHLTAALVWVLGLATTAGVLGAGVLLRDANVGAQIVGVALIRTGLLVVLHAIPALILTRRYAGVSMHAILGAVTPAVAAATAATIASVVLTGSQAIAGAGPLAGLLVRGILTTTVALGVLYALDPISRELLAEARDAVRPALRRAVAAARTLHPKSVGDEAT